MIKFYTILIFSVLITSCNSDQSDVQNNDVLMVGDWKFVDSVTNQKVDRFSIENSSLEKNGTVTSIFTNQETKELQKILNFFVAQICTSENVNQSDPTKCFNKFMTRLKEDSPSGYLVEKIFLASHQNFKQLNTQGKKIRYVDWVLPGILGMNMMFSCLFGVGYVIVRYRKNSVLKRLKATPLSAFEFVSAQLLSRTFIVMFTSCVVYIGCNFFFDFYMLGSYFDLFIVGLLGAFSLITLGLLVACRSKSEELVGGLLNLTSWPMMILSGVWFSLEGAPDTLKSIADLLPLTHLVAGARKVITEGASLADISYHLGVLVLMSTIFLSLGAYLFDWNAER